MFYLVFIDSICINLLKNLLTKVRVYYMPVDIFIYYIIILVEFLINKKYLIIGRKVLEKLVVLVIFHSFYMKRTRVK